MSTFRTAFDRPGARNKASIRWWPAVLLLLVTTAALIWTWTAGGKTDQDRTLQTLGIVLLTLLGFLLWALLFSRLPGRARLAILGLSVLLVVGLAASVRIRGVSGNLMPLLTWRWAGGGDGPTSTVSDGLRLLDDSYRDFPQFLGPDRDGVVSGIRLAADWEVTPPVELWRRPVGEGWSSFAIQAGFAVTQEQDGDDEAVVAYDLATGERLWKHRYPARYSTTIGGTGPRATPAIADSRVHSLGATGVLTAVALADGRPLWSRNVLADHGGALPEWGKSSSPLVHEGRVIVSAGGGAGHSLVAYDAESGQPLWHGGSDASGYSSPQIVTLGEVDQIVIFNKRSVAGHDPATGRLLWQHDWPATQENVSQPLALPQDRLLVSSGYGIGAKMLRIARTTDGGWTSERVWETPRMKAKFTNFVTHGGFVYGLDDGILACLDPETGEQRWKRGRYGHGQILRVEDRLLIQAENGDLALVEANPEAYRELARFPALDGKTWNHPALAGGYVVVRNDREAVCLRLPLLQVPRTEAEPAAASARLSGRE